MDDAERAEIRELAKRGLRSLEDAELRIDAARLALEGVLRAKLKYAPADDTERWAAGERASIREIVRDVRR